MKGLVWGGVAAALLVGAGVWWFAATPSQDGSAASAAKPGGRPVAAVPAKPRKGPIAEAEPAVPAAESEGAACDPSEPGEEPQTEEERREAEEERRVDAFDALTDAWMEPSAKGVTMQDVEKFRKTFASVPKDRREECLQRALNLVPDENVMLLAGILMDKTQDKELVELVFNDVLNRDEDVKMPLLKEIFKDKKHPCWADTAWILDVTGEKR